MMRVVLSFFLTVWIFSLRDSLRIKEIPPMIAMVPIPVRKCNFSPPRVMAKTVETSGFDATIGVARATPI